MCCKITSGKDKEGKEVSRSYTPISKVHKRGQLELLIKVYFPTERFPDGGVVSQYLHSKDRSDMIKIAGPKGRIQYQGKGKFFFSQLNKKKTYKKVSCVGGGSGLTPLYQVITHMLEETDQKYDLSLLFANKSEEDILMRQELDQLKESGRLNLAYCVDKGSESWKGFTGFVNERMLKQALPVASPDHLVLICGPYMMVKDVEKGLKDLGFNNENVFKF